MSRLPRGNFDPYRPPRPPHVYRRRRRRRRVRRLRWWILTIPLTLIILIWFVQGVEPFMTFSDFCARIGVHNVELYARLGILGVLGVVVTLLLRIWRQ